MKRFLVIIITVLVLAGGGLVGLRVWHNKNSGSSTSTNIYTGWKTYVSNLGKFNLRYPSSWSISGFQGETPVGPSYSTGEMNGKETIVRLLNNEDSQNQFGMDITLTNTPSDSYDNYSDGAVTPLTNGLSVWIHNEEPTSGAGRAGTCPDVQFVSGQSFIAKLTNGTSLTLNGSFCWSQNSNPTYAYTQQVNSVSFRQAKQILVSIQPQ